ncbi:MAG: lipid IV(A) 3-deoxy-D-manno-octulosonic acid transferase [Porticoccaceae bacterium]
MNLPRLIYSVIFYLLTPLIAARLMYRAIKAPAYRLRWPERLGFVSPVSTEKQSIWVHAVSVGETLAAVPLVKVLQKKYPDYRLVVTCMTPTGSERVKAAFGDSVDHCYAPYDMPDSVARFLDRVKPKMAIIMETELWPNTIAACHKRKIPLVLANGRLSEKSAAAYRRIQPLVRPMLAQLTAAAVQNKDDGARFTDLGLAQSALIVTGNIKFDLSLGQAIKDNAQQLQTEWCGADRRPVLLVASTHRGEDEIILNAFKQIKAEVENLLLVIVPRHPERFNQVAELCTSAGFKLARRSRADQVGSADILLGDTMGELMTFFGACDIAFIGGSLVPTGGHNIIEPAAWGVPVLTGPHLFNFSEASQLLLDGGAMQICQSADQIAEQVVELLQNPAQRAEMGSAAQRIAEANRGALDRLLGVIEKAI